MNGVVARWISWTPYFHALLRIIAAFLFILSGTPKLFEWPVPIPAEFGGTPALMSQAGIGGILEVFGGALILVGLFTRPTAFILSGMMAVAYFQFHAPGSFWPTVNGGLPAVLFCFVWLYFSAAGAGPWSLDGLRAPRDASPTS